MSLATSNIIKAQNPSGEVVTFDPTAHTYRVGGRVLTSTTTLLSEYFEKFDTETISLRYAKKHNRSQEEVKKEWEEIRLEGERRGTLVHDYAESLLKGEDLPEPEEPEDQLYFNCVNVAVVMLLKKFEFIDAEWVIFSPRMGLGGMIDIWMRDRASKDYVLLDWKATNSLKDEPFNGRKAKGPINHLPDTDWTKYELQLNTYEKILRVEKYIHYDDRVRKGIIHIRPGPHKPHVGWHKVEDRQAEVKGIINDRLGQDSI
jgi:hypothetical protein